METGLIIVIYTALVCVVASTFVSIFAKLKLLRLDSKLKKMEFDNKIESLKMQKENNFLLRDIFKILTKKRLENE